MANLKLIGQHLVFIWAAGQGRLEYWLFWFCPMRPVPAFDQSISSLVEPSQNLTNIHNPESSLSFSDSSVVLSKESGPKLIWPQACPAIASFKLCKLIIWHMYAVQPGVGNGAPWVLWWCYQMFPAITILSPAMPLLHCSALHSWEIITDQRIILYKLFYIGEFWTS